MSHYTNYQGFDGFPDFKIYNDNANGRYLFMFYKPVWGPIIIRIPVTKSTRKRNLLKAAVISRYRILYNDADCLILIRPKIGIIWIVLL